jgi:hypothetical protein
MSTAFHASPHDRGVRSRGGSNSVSSDGGNHVEAHCPAQRRTAVRGSYAFILLKNGVATLATCTILGANTICQDLVNSVALAANDRSSILVVPNNTPGPRQMSWTAIFTPTPS